MKIKIKKSVLFKDNKNHKTKLKNTNNKIENSKKEKKHKVNSLFFTTYEKNKRKIYITCLFKDIIKTELKKDNSNIFLISHTRLKNNKKRKGLKLYKKENDKFLGIYYSKEIIKKPISIKEKEINEIFYIEFRFKDGSVFLALDEIRKIIRKEYSNLEYYEKFIEKINKLEKDVYSFYSKKLENSIFDKFLGTFNS